MPRLSIIILNYRTPAMTVDCLASLAPEVAANPDTVVAVVDNASGDDSAGQVEQAIQSNNWSSWARLVQADANNGFAAGNNIGIAAAQADAYLLLNSDTLVRPGAIKSLLQALDSNDRIGLIGPRLEWPDGQPQVSCFRYRSPLSELVGAAGLSVVDRLFPGSVVAIPVSDSPIQPQWISFACVLLRGEVIEQIGVLDDGFFMYFEDIDFARRARNAGWVVHYEPAAHVVHLRGGSSAVKETKAKRNRVPRYYYESRTRYFAKWYGGIFGVWMANLCWLIGRSISWVMEVVRGREPFHCQHEGRDNWINWLDPFRRSALVEGDRS